MPVTTDRKVTSVKLHRFSLTYIFLWLGATLLRYSIASNQKKRIAEQIKTIPANVERIVIRVPSREAGRTIELHSYGLKGKQSAQPPAVHVNFHGSAFVFPMLGTDTTFCSLLASRVGCIVLDCDYRKGPEYPYPAALEDAEDIIAYIFSNPSTFDTTRITVGGFSAGGNIAMSLAANRMGKEQCRGVVGVYANPNLSKRLPPPDTEFVSGNVSPEWLRTFTRKCFINPLANAAYSSLSSTLLSPGLDPSLFPKYVLLACGTADSMYVNGKELITRLREERGYAEDKAVWLNVDKEAHAFDKSYKKGSVTEGKVQVMYDSMVDFIRKAQA